MWVGANSILVLLNTRKKNFSRHQPLRIETKKKRSKDWKNNRSEGKKTLYLNSPFYAFTQSY